MKTSKLLMEYRSAMGRMTLDDITSEFRRHGVSTQVIAAICPVPMNISVDRSGELYQPDEAGRLAWLVPVRIADLEIPDEIEAADPLTVVSSGVIVDLLVFSPSAPSRYALRCGIANVLRLHSAAVLQPRSGADPSRCDPLVAQRVPRARSAES
jgi:hypothetical protein